MDEGGLVDKVGTWLSIDQRVRRTLRFVPPFRPIKYRRRYAPPRGPWPEFTLETPAELLDIPGIRRDPVGEEQAFAEGPLPALLSQYPNSLRKIRAGMWHASLPTAPRFERGMAAVKRTAARARRPKGLQRGPVSSAQLSAELRDYAAKLGMSAIGVAKYDEKYTFAPFVGGEVGDRMIVCVVEQNYETTQKIPSAEGERAALNAYAEIMRIGAKLAEFLQSQGFRAEPYEPNGKAVMIHYGVEAGLGQLGRNGQLLTPSAGSRCRLIGINTDAPLDFDSPRDFGINKICDSCEACVRRCPSNAIPRGPRRYHRGVEKAKISTKRCLPLIAKAGGCAVCMKVCPVQRYGLAAVYEEFERSGTILGRETEDLESYVWPIDGKTYGPGERPNFSEDFFFELD